MLKDAIGLFDNWYKEELQQSKLKLPSACSFSTIGLDGYPNSRFVSLKEVKEQGFVVTGAMSSRKGHEIKLNNKTSLNFWWPHTQRQVRVQGDAFSINNEDADKYFAERQRDSQIVSLTSAQGQELSDLEVLNRNYTEAEILYDNKDIPRPENWGGWLIKPLRIEFMQFKESRFHERILFFNTEGQWHKKLIQP